MTALEQYIRLESTGRWKEHASAPWREVVVSFGNATLVLSNFSDNPLTHWSLAAIHAQSAGEGAMTYRPDINSEEALEVSDQAMTEAIAAVSQTLRDTVPQTQTRRSSKRVILGIGALVLGGALAIFGPEILRKTAVSLIPPERAALISEEVEALLNLPVCDRPDGLQSLHTLTDALRLTPQQNVIITPEKTNLIRLPGGHMMLSRDVLYAATAPEAIAGWIAMGLSLPTEENALHAMIRAKSLPDLVEFIATGQVHDADLEWVAKHVSKQRFTPSPTDILQARADLAAVRISDKAFLASLRKLYPEPPIDDAAPTGGHASLLTDQDWVALQEICAE